MKQIKVLGTGCASCKATVEMIRQVAAGKGVAIELEKIEELPEIMSYSIMSTPGVVVDGDVVHVGGIPKRVKVEAWLDAE